MLTGSPHIVISLWFQNTKSYAKPVAIKRAHFHQKNFTYNDNLWKNRQTKI